MASKKCSVEQQRFWMHTDKPKVLHVIARFNVGGTARYLDDLLPGLAEQVDTLLAVGHVQGHEIEDSRLEKIKFVRIEHLGRKINLMQDFCAYFELRKTVKKFKPQIIHSHTFKAGLLSRLMFFKIPKIHTFHGHLLSDPEFSRRALQVIVNIERRLAKVTKTLITVGEQVSKDLLQVGVGKPSQYISIASEGQKLIFLSRDQARANLGIDLETPVVLWMARMAPVKNPSLALEVAQLLPKVSFLMAGGGELFNQIRNQASPNVRLLGWVDAADVIPSADIFLSTSLNEGIPYSLLEVLSAGVPVVAVESGAIAEIIRERVSGVLTSKEPAEIAAQISGLFSDPTQRLKAGESAKNSTTRSAIAEKMVPTHIDVYKEILGLNSFN
jgi:glycosyltransferase involved in cell wall biosynthesis